VSQGPRLGPEGEAALESVLAALRSEASSVSSVREPDEARRVHVDDSLSGLEVPELAAARRIADLGAGAGFPGLPLAVALPGSRIDLIESVARKCEFMRRAAAAAGIGNARVVCARSEDWAKGEGREAYDAVTARAVAPLAELAELASPLLREGAVLVAWKGDREPDEEGDLEAAAEALAMSPESVVAVQPYPGSRNRHLHVVRKSGPTPARLPRRAGMARKRPVGARRARRGRV
jgi:16S rRNA (guanine527-N7)-methyltransferase